MQLETKPYKSTRTYFGKIQVPEVQDVITEEDGSISFILEVIEEDNPQFDLEVTHHHELSYHIHIGEKTKSYGKVRGKSKTAIIYRIMQAIKEQNLIL